MARLEKNTYKINKWYKNVKKRLVNKIELFGTIKKNYIKLYRAQVKYGYMNKDGRWHIIS